jgi:putative addiction module component (TIGR02574 family)
MHGTREIIAEAIALPIEERAVVVDSLLRSLNSPSDEIEREWIDLARRRQAELRSGRVQPVEGEAVLARLRKRFAR